MAAVALDGRTDIPSVDAVGWHVLTLGRCDMDDDAGTWWGKWLWLKSNVPWREP